MRRAIGRTQKPAVGEPADHRVSRPLVVAQITYQRVVLARLGAWRVRIRRADFDALIESSAMSGDRQPVPPSIWDGEIPLPQGPAE
jgi:hypothetical protein